MSLTKKDGTAGIIGAVIGALLLLFGLYTANPFALKSEVETFGVSVNQRLDRIEKNVDDIRNYLLGPRPGGR